MTKLRRNEEYKTLNKHEHKTLNKILWNTNTKQTWTQKFIAMWNTRFKKKRKKRRIYDSKQILNKIQLLKKSDHRILNKCGIQHSRILNKCGIQHSSKVKTTTKLVNTKQWPATRVNHSSPVSVSLILFYLATRCSFIPQIHASEFKQKWRDLMCPWHARKMLKLHLSKISMNLSLVFVLYLLHPRTGKKNNYNYDNTYTRIYQWLK